MNPPDYFDRYDAEQQQEPAEHKTCKFCGTGGLVWQRVKVEHNRKELRLVDYDTGAIHRCTKPSATDDFKKVPK